MSNIFFICIEIFKNGIIIKVLYILLGVNYEHNMCWWTFLFFKSQDWKSANRCFLFGNYFPDVSSLIAASLTAGGTKYLKEKCSWSWFPVWILKIVCMLYFFQRISFYFYIISKKSTLLPCLFWDLSTFLGIFPNFNLFSLWFNWRTAAMVMIVIKPDSETMFGLRFNKLGDLF